MGGGRCIGVFALVPVSLESFLADYQLKLKGRAAERCGTAGSAAHPDGFTLPICGWGGNDDRNGIRG